MSGCCFLGEMCRREPPPSHHRWAKVREVYLAFLKQTTIADLARKPALSVQLVGP